MLLVSILNKRGGESGKYGEGDPGWAGREETWPASRFEADLKLGGEEGRPYQRRQQNLGFTPTHALDSLAVCMALGNSFPHCGLGFPSAFQMVFQVYFRGHLDFL